MKLIASYIVPGKAQSGFILYFFQIIGVVLHLNTPMPTVCRAGICRSEYMSVSVM
jgi:hypothetical protein